MLATLIGCPHFLQDSLSDPQPYVLHTVHPLSIATLSFSLGYFVADLVLMTQTAKVPAMVTHHVGGVIALLTTLVSGHCHLYGLILLSTEITTPCICLRWYVPPLLCSVCNARFCML